MASRKEDLLSSSLSSECDDFSDLINLDEINFSDDETWLTGPCKNDKHSSDASNDIFVNSIENRTFDTRTFTRPKKSLSRAPVDTTFDLKSTNDSQCRSSFRGKNSSETPVKFRLSEPVTVNFFDRMVVSGSESMIMNMSPPSLVNSLCSSTFSSMMESSHLGSVEVNHEPFLLLDKKDFIENEPITLPIRRGSSSSVDSESQEFVTARNYRPPDYLDNQEFNKTITINTNSPARNQTFTQSELAVAPEANAQNSKYRSSFKGSTDSLENSSSTISSSSKESCRMMSMGELDNLAKLQEQSLQIMMSTPTKQQLASNILIDEEISPINTDTLPKRSFPSDKNSPTRKLREHLNQTFSPESNRPFQSNTFRKSPKTDSNALTQIKNDANSTFSVPQNAGNVAITERKNVNATFEKAQPVSISPPVFKQPELRSTLSKATTLTSKLVPPQIRTSGLPRPAPSSTSIPRPLSKLPTARFVRPSLMKK